MLKITQIEKTLENMVKVSEEPNIAFLRYGQRIKPTGERHKLPVEDAKKEYMISLNWKMLDSMKVSDMKKWLEDPATAIVRFEIVEE